MARQLTALLLVWPALAGAAPETPESLLARMTRLARSTRTLKGQFIQRKRLSLFDSEVTTRGTFAYRKPSWFRWETLPPDASVLVVDGDKLTISSGHGTRGRKMDLGEGMRAFLEDVMVWVGAKPARRLIDRYSIRLEGGRLTLEPKTAESGSAGFLCR